MSVCKVCVDCEMSLLCISGSLPHTGIFQRFSKLYTLYEVDMDTPQGVIHANVPIGCPRVKFLPDSMEWPKGRGRIHWGPPPKTTKGVVAGDEP